MSRLSQLSDRDIVARLKTLVATERSHLVEILKHLSEVERRKLHLESGFSSLFEYCVSRLRYSHSAAGRRIAAARALRAFPGIDAMLASGDVSLTTLSMIARLLTPANKDSLLSRIRGKSQREVERIIAEYRPESTTRDRVRTVRVRERVTLCKSTPGAGSATPSRNEDTGRGGASLGDLTGNPDRNTGGAPEGGDESNPDPTENPPPTRVVLKHEIKFVAGKQFMKTFERVKALLSNRLPNATFEQVLESAMEAFLNAKCPVRRSSRRKAKRKLKKNQPRCKCADAMSTAGNPLPAPGVNQTRNLGRMDAGSAIPRRTQTNLTRHIPVAVRDEVYERDRGHCAYMSPGGMRCSSRAHLQFDHVLPFGRGGTHAASNLRLLCRAHNLLAAEHTYGHNVIAGYTRRE